MILITTAAFVAGTLIMNPNAIETMTVVAATVADAHGDDVDVGIVSNLPPLEADGCGDATIYLLTLELSVTFSDLSPSDTAMELDNLSGGLRCCLLLMACDTNLQ